MTRHFIRRESLLLFTTIIICLIGITSVRRYNSVKLELANASVVAIRTDVHDRLMGTVVDVASLNVGEESWHALAEGRPLVIWVLDLERCDACLASIGEWRRLEGLEDHELGLLIIGEPTDHAEQYLRTLSRTHVSRTDRATVFAQLGPILPNTKFLLDIARVAVLVDSRPSGTECVWSFESQIGYLHGLNPSSSIRSVARLE